MFFRETVVVAGAGASWHYGFPTGDQLVTKIIERAGQFRQYCERAKSSGATFLPQLMIDAISQQDRTGYRTIMQSCDNLVDRLRKGNPLVIDYFLGHNHDLEAIGKFLIAWEILEAQERSAMSDRNPQRIDAAPKNQALEIPPLSTADDWLRYFSHAISSGCENPRRLLENKLHFITFNYDEIIESRLLAQLSSLFEPKLVEAFLKNRVTHVYGSVGATIPGLVRFGWNAGATEVNASLLNKIHEKSHGLRIIEPHSKSLSPDAAGKLENAERIFVLGYGFDEYNSARIGLGKGLTAIPEVMKSNAFQKEIFVTNFCGHDRVSKRLGRLAGRSPNDFVKDRTVYAGRRTVEMSVRNVHDALAFDFEGYDFRSI